MQGRLTRTTFNYHLLIRYQSDDNCLRIIEKLEPSERPLDILGHSAGKPFFHYTYTIVTYSRILDPKCRFFWKMTETPPYETAFPSLNMSNVVPERLEDPWAPTLNKWGQSMKNA